MIDGRVRRLACSLSLLAAAAGVLAPREAAADDAELHSRQLFKHGEALANGGAFREACPLFQAAHELHATGGTALRTADCYEKLGKYERALELYQYIVDHRDTDRAPGRVTLAEGRVAALRKQLDLDRPPPPPAPPAPPPAVDPPAPAPPPPSRAPAYVSFGVGGAGLVVGAVLGGLALAQAREVKAACDHLLPAPCAPEAAHKSAAETKAWVANAGFGVAIAGAVTGVVLLLIRPSPRAQAVRSALGPGGMKLRF